MKKDLVVYIHGKGGSPDEADFYRPLFPDRDVIGFDYRSNTPWDAKGEFEKAFRSYKMNYERIVLIANSIGAFFAMNAPIDALIKKAYFISPVVDMEKLIAGMMISAGVTEDELRARGVIKTSFGEDLSWAYLTYVREHPINWTVPTRILYGSKDALTSFDTVSAFAERYHARLTVMEGGEHWFHTEEQMRFLEDFIKMDKTDCVIRREKEEEQREVENLIRESFWNVYRPGCLEHYVIHVLRDDPAFVRELDFVMEKNGRLIGQNMFMKTVIEADDGRKIDVLTMGPICIAPDLKRKGYGKILLDHSLEKAADMGFGAVLFEGNIGFYGKSGFDYARNFGVRYHDLPEGADDSFFLCKELIPGYLDGVTGVYQTPAGYYVSEEGAEAFDALFPPKKKQKLPGQLF